jgi:hypothetical protein
MSKLKNKKPDTIINLPVPQSALRPGGAERGGGIVSKWNEEARRYKGVVRKAQTLRGK